MSRIYFDNFRMIVIRHVREMESWEIETHTTEWFLIKYLRRIIKTTEDEPVSPGRVEGAVRSLIRFYVDNVDENSVMGEKCNRIYEEYRKTLRENQEKRDW